MVEPYAMKPSVGHAALWIRGSPFQVAKNGGKAEGGKAVCDEPLVGNRPAGLEAYFSR